MDPMAEYELGLLLYEDRLRAAARRGRLWRSNQFRRLPRLVQFLISALG